MITFNDLIETKNNLKGVEALNERLEKMPNASKATSTINTSSMKAINKLLGKYFNAKTKVILKQITPKTSNWNRGNRIEFSKAGIGYVNEYSTNNTPYDELYKEKNSFIDRVLKDDEVFNKAKECVSEEGKKILNSIKEVYKNNKISNIHKNRYKIDFKIAPEELSVLNINDENGIIELTDSNGFDLIIIEKKESVKEFWSRKEIFEEEHIKDYKNETNFIYALFTENHIDVFNTLLDNYQKKTAPEIEQWQKFDTALKQKLAKYLILEKI